MVLKTKLTPRILEAIPELNDLLKEVTPDTEFIFTVKPISHVSKSTTTAKVATEDIPADGSDADDGYVGSTPGKGRG